MLVSDLLYIAQFEALRVWAGRLAAADADRPSVLPGWTVRHLVAHLQGVADTVTALQPAPPDPGVEPMTFGDYLDRVRAAAQQVQQETWQRTDAVGSDLSGALAEGQGRARRRLAELGGADRAVLARRGPILLSTFLDTRVLELVVHADDLARSLPDSPPPAVLPAARARVVGALREVLAARAADPVAAVAAASEMGSIDFLRGATGRSKAEPAPALAEVFPLI